MVTIYQPKCVWGDKILDYMAEDIISDLVKPIKLWIFIFLCLIKGSCRFTFYGFITIGIHHEPQPVTWFYPIILSYMEPRYTNLRYALF